ncbi:hypothetical protein H6501_04755 [Candidatus Woesearchaeota archaeon]|nr:hypothetical protein [Candidatus Woesearchaeota archaeon]USN43984.1 MAG: hypothetical protein H6500_06360 [Candidatus Woesearchaeota archaeon]
MNILRRGISPVVAVALLLVVAVVAVVMFSSWFDSFRSSLFADIEVQTLQANGVDIIDLVGEDLFFQAGTNTSVSSVKVSGNECEFSTGIFSGLHVFDLTSCLDASSSSVEAVVVTDKGIYSKKFFVGESYHSRELLPVLLWNASSDAGDDEEAYGIALDSLDNVYVAGDSYNGADYDAWTIKYDSDGNEIWNVTYDGGNDDGAYGVAVDKFGDVYVMVDSNNGVDSDILTFKYDSNGNQIWNVTYDSGENDISGDFFFDGETYFYITGSESNGIDEDTLVLKYDTNGNQIWNVTYDRGNGDDGANGIAVDAAGNLYLAEAFSNGIDRDFLLVKYDSLLNELWNFSYDAGSGDDFALDVEVDSSGNVYVAGEINAGPSYDMITFKFDSLGNEIWNVTYDGGNLDGGWGIALDASGNAYVSGQTDDGVDYYQLLVFKYNNLGTELWNVTYGGPDYEYGYRIILDGAGNVYTTGGTYNGVDMDFLTLKYAQE